MVLAGFLAGSRVGQVMPKPDPDFTGSGRAGRFMTQSPSESNSNTINPTQP